MEIFRGYLLKISPKSKWMYLILFPAIYGFWLNAIVNRIVQNRFEKRMLLTFTCYISISLTIITVTIPFIFLKRMEMNGSYIIFLLLSVLIWTITIIMIASSTLKFEKKNLSKESNRPTSLMEFYTRYFVLQNWWIGIWSYQRIVNMY
jgi:hypothetical protein